MWPTMLNPQGPHTPSLLSMPTVKKQPQRHLAMFSSPLPINGNKSFKNPNFVNTDFDKYKPKSLDSFVSTNSNHVIIDSIKEKCPAVIPNLNVPETANDLQSEETQNSANNTSPGHKENMVNTKHKSKDCNKTKQRKKLRQSVLLEELNSMAQEESSSEFSDISQSLEISFSPKPSNHTLAEFIPLSPSQHHIDSVLVTIKASPPLRRYSVSDSEDSFILFAEPEQTSSPNQYESHCNSPCRTRRPSYCDSEDSFIVFEGGDESSYIEASDSEEDEDEVDFCHAKDQKKVTFASTDKLCQIHPMIKWSFAYKAARKGPWEMYAWDRARFKDRILRVEREIKHVFDPQHRDRVYRQRFENF